VSVVVDNKAYLMTRVSVGVAGDGGGCARESRVWQRRVLGTAEAAMAAAWEICGGIVGGVMAAGARGEGGTTGGWLFVCGFFSCCCLFGCWLLMSAERETGRERGGRRDGRVRVCAGGWTGESGIVESGIVVGDFPTCRLSSPMERRHGDTAIRGGRKRRIVGRPAFFSLIDSYRRARGWR
jgi:hypothetical protein